MKYKLECDVHRLHGGNFSEIQFRKIQNLIIIKIMANYYSTAMCAVVRCHQ